MSTTIILFASSRRNGNTGKLTDRISNELGLDVTDLGGKAISAFDYEHSNRNDDFEPLMEKVLRCENIIFATPIYWYSVAPSMKIFLDRISDYLDVPELLEKGRMLRGKKGFIICTSISDLPDEPFISAFKETFAFLGMEYGGFINANCKNGFEANLYEKDIKLFVEHFQD